MRAKLCDPRKGGSIPTNKGREATPYPHNPHPGSFFMKNLRSFNDFLMIVMLKFKSHAKTT